MRLFHSLQDLLWRLELLARYLDGQVGVSLDSLDCLHDLEVFGLDFLSLSVRLFGLLLRLVNLLGDFFLFALQLVGLVLNVFAERILIFLLRALLRDTRLLLVVFLLEHQVLTCQLLNLFAQIAFLQF